MKVIFLLLIFSELFSQTSFAQQALITCSSQHNADNSYTIIAENRGYGDYTVKLIFTTLSGYSASPAIYSPNIALTTARRGRSQLLTLTPDKTSGSHLFQFRYEYFPGKALTRYPDTSFVYLLPANAGSQVRILKVQSVEEKIGQKSASEFYSTGFMYKLGDTICASRAGTVYLCNDAEKEGEKKTEFYKSERNRIGIQQKDGSLCTYSILSPIKLLISPGDEVLPGTALAVFNKESEKYAVLCLVQYLDEKDLLDNSNNAGLPGASSYVYLPVHFYSGENTSALPLQLNSQYTVQHPKNIIAAEMSKKEKRKLGL